MKIVWKFKQYWLHSQCIQKSAIYFILTVFRFQMVIPQLLLYSVIVCGDLSKFVCFAFPLLILDCIVHLEHCRIYRSDNDVNCCFYCQITVVERQTRIVPRIKLSWVWTKGVCLCLFVRLSVSLSDYRCDRQCGHRI